MTPTIWVVVALLTIAASIALALIAMAVVATTRNGFKLPTISSRTSIRVSIALLSASLIFVIASILVLFTEYAEW